MNLFRYFNSVVSNGIWLTILGIGSLMLGCLGFAMAFPLSVLMTFWLGVMVILRGVLRLAMPFVGELPLGESTTESVVLGGLFVSSGLVVALNPVEATFALTVLVGVLLIGGGFLRGFFAYTQESGSDFNLPAVTSMVSVILGSLILLQWPFSGLWVVGLFVACELVISGMAAIVAGLRLGWNAPGY